MSNVDPIKGKIEGELAGAGAAGPPAASSFSRGWVFSRSSQALAEIEQVILPAMQMDDEKFRVFAERMTQITQAARQMKEPPTK